MININGLEPKQYNVTSEGMKELGQQLQDLKRRRMEIADELREISSQSTDVGARTDSTFAFNQNQAIEVDGQIELLERILALANVIPIPESKERVQLGSQVRVRVGDKEQSYMIVGSIEADPLEGKISDASPFGSSLLGKKLHDKIEALSPVGQRIDATILGIA